MSDLLIRSSRAPAAGAASVKLSSPSALRYVGFEVHDLALGEARDWPADELERCLVVLSGTVAVHTPQESFTGIGSRRDVFSGLPCAAFVPARLPCEVIAETDAVEVAVCSAPGASGYAPYAIASGEIEVEVRGVGAMERHVHPILMADRPAHSLLVVEVLTPAGHWSSYPPHKHDEDAPPRETFLEESYYHRVSPPAGFGMQRVYTADGALDEAIVFGDRDVVLVPRGYHTVSMPPGYSGYYLNVMAGPVREWRMSDDPAHAWLRTW